MLSQLVQLKVGDVCMVDIDWSNLAEGKRCRIYRLFTSGGRVYADVIWARNHKEMDRVVGSIFSVDDELRKVG